MANPQPEDGHIDIANGIAEALCRTSLSSYESRVLWFIFRKTYGWHKESDNIPLSQICAASGIAKPNVIRTLKSLDRRRIITRQGRLIGFQKDYDLWVLPPSSRKREYMALSEEKPLSLQTPLSPETTPSPVYSPSPSLSPQTTLSPKTTTVIYPDNKTLSPEIPSKETTKETCQKKKGPRPSKEGRADPRVIEIMAAISSRVGYQIPLYAKEAAAVKHALKQGYSSEQFLACWEILKKDPFWQNKWLPLTKVVENLGEFTKGRLHSGPTKTSIRLPTHYTRPEDVDQD